jgi:hypothetical protein
MASGFGQQTGPEAEEMAQYISEGMYSAFYLAWQATYSF